MKAQRSRRTTEQRSANFAATDSLNFNFVDGRGRTRITIRFRDDVGARDKVGKQAEIEVRDKEGNTVSHLAIFDLD